MRKFLTNWWNGLRYEPGDPRYLAGGDFKVAAIGGGTGLSTLLRGIKHYSSQISAVVTVTDNGSSTGRLRKEFDIVAPGDIRKCIAALAEDEERISKLFEYRFKNGNGFSGHTLGNIWLTALTEYLGSFDKAVELTTEIFKTAGKVLPSTLDNVNLVIKYKDGTVLEGEYNLDEVVKGIDRVSFNKKQVSAYKKSVTAIEEADLILIGPGSLYGSIIPNILITDIAKAVRQNTKAVKIYIANCSTERTQTAKYTIEDHIKVLHRHAGEGIFDYCLVNSNVVKQSDQDIKLGEVNNITTEKREAYGVKIIRRDVIDEKNPLYHDPYKLSREVVNIYHEARSRKRDLAKLAALERG